MPTGALRPHVIVTTSGTDAACAAALILREHKSADILVTSQRAVAWTLRGIAYMEPRPAAVDICGVGIADNETDVKQALEALACLGIQTHWHCGRGYLNPFRESLESCCTTVFVECRSNTEAVWKHLKEPKGDTVSLLLTLAREYVERTGNAPADHRFYHDLLDAGTLRYFQFGEKDAYIRAIHKLAGFLPYSKADQDEVAFYRSVGKKEVSLGSSKPMKKLRTQIKRVADIDEPVLILGPSGSGKELVARALHHGSNRRSAKFIPVNCAVLSTNAELAHDRLFGHVKGAYTNALRSVPGAFEEANGGSLFLDEVAELPVAVQTQLLRVLEEKTITPLGTIEAKPVDVRVIAATNQNLPAMVSQGRFRLDLYYRLNVLTLEVPPLRDRVKDARAISDSVLHELHAKGCALKLTADDWQAIYEYGWPGNIRQFRNVLKRAAYMKRPVREVLEQEARLSCASGENSLPDSLARALRLFRPEDVEEVAPEADVRRAYMEHVFSLFEGNWSRACKALGVSNNTLRSWLKIPS